MIWTYLVMYIVKPNMFSMVKNVRNFENKAKIWIVKAGDYNI